MIADRWFASSKTCSNCATIKESLSLSERTFIFVASLFTLDRDLNAAINLAVRPPSGSQSLMGETTGLSRCGTCVRTQPLPKTLRVSLSETLRERQSLHLGRPRQLLYLGRPQDRTASQDPPGSAVAPLGGTPRPHCTHRTALTALCAFVETLHVTSLQTCSTFAIDEATVMVSVATGVVPHS